MEADCSSLLLLPVEDEDLAAGLVLAYTQLQQNSGFLASFELC